MRTIVSKSVGKLVQDKNFEDWWKSEEIAIPFFNNEPLSITFTDFEPDADLEFINRADSALSRFLQFGEKDRLKMSELVFRNYSDLLEAVGNDVEFQLDVNGVEDIWRFVHPFELYVSRRPYSDKDIYVLIHCSCDWEEEHGLQLVFRQGRQLTRVSDIDGHLTEADAYGKPDGEDKLLSRFNNGEQ